MPKSLAITVILAIAAASSIGFAADPNSAELLRVYDPGQKPDDPRYALHDIDHPADFTGRFATKAVWEERAADLRRQILVAEGLWPMPEKTPMNATIFGKIDRDEYTIEKVYFPSMPGHYVTGNLYRPKSAGKHPVVLSPHGHWPDGRLVWYDDKTAQKQIDAGAEQTLDGGHSPLQARCAMLARMGCVVFHYDMVGYADSDKLVHRQGMADVESVLRLQSQMGLQTWNGIRAIDFVTGLDDVDAGRIAVTGASGGGTQTFILAAVDPRVSVAFPAVMVGMAMQGGCVCENAPLLRVGTNNAEIAALFAPKPLAMSSANDWTVDLVTRGLPELKSIYRLFGTPQLVAAEHFSFPHNYNQVSREMMYGWFNEHLKLGSAKPVKERPFVAVPPKELAVWDAQHPEPADAAATPALRKIMTERSDKQMADLAADTEKYRAVVGPALAAMIVDKYPTPSGVRVAKQSGPIRLDDLTLERGVVERVADGTKVPYAAGFPDEWDGAVVIWVNPGGKQAILNADGNPPAELLALLAAKAAVVVPDLFWTGEFLPDGKPAPAPANPIYAPGANPAYAAFDLGYNRSVLGNRVHDLLSVVAMTRGWAGTKSVRVLGVGKAGPWALLAKAAANEAIDKAAADLGNFDFDRVSEPGDEMLIPGALKYGGIYGFVPLCTHGQTLLINARKTGSFDRAKAVKGVTLESGEKSLQDLTDWLMQ